MNKTINKFSLTGDKFMPELYLKQPGFAQSPRGLFTKHRERIQKFRETGNSEQLYRNQLGKAYFPHDVAYSDSKDLAKRTILDKILKDGGYVIIRNHKFDRYQRALPIMVYIFLDKKQDHG